MSDIGHTHVSDLAVERYLLGEMTRDESRAFEHEAAACPECGARLSEAEADNRAFAFQPVPQSLRARIQRDRRKSRAFFLAWAGAVPVAAALAVAVAWPSLRSAPGTREVGGRGGQDVVRLKGAEATIGSSSLSLGFYVSRPGGSSSVGKPGERLGKGDRIQFWYDSTVSVPFALIGVDGRGNVTTYFATAKDGRPLAIGSGLSLGGAVELDDATGAERFFLCAGKDAWKLRDVERAARSLANSSGDMSRVEKLPFSCEQATVWINKL